MTDFRQTSVKRQTPTSDFGPRPDFEHQTSDFGLLTLNFTLQILDRLRTSDIRVRALNFILRVRILDVGYTSDRPRPSDFELRSLNFRLCTI